MCYWSGQRPIAVHELEEHEAITGWKLLVLSVLVDRGTLLSPYQKTRWTTGAGPHGGLKRGDVRPQPGWVRAFGPIAEKGVYAFKGRQAAVRYRATSRRWNAVVLARLDLFGTVVEYAGTPRPRGFGSSHLRTRRHPGYRASHARIREVIIPAMYRNGVEVRPSWSKSWDVQFLSASEIVTSVKGRYPLVDVRLARPSSRDPRPSSQPAVIVP
jgi:hypothetical protein